MKRTNEIITIKQMALSLSLSTHLARFKYPLGVTIRHNFVPPPKSD